MTTTPNESPTELFQTARSVSTKDRGMILSTLWIAVMFNYLYCDLMAFMDSRLLKEYLTGNVNGLDITQGFLLGAAVLMQIPISMIVLSRVLKRQANRWANIAAGSVMTAIQFATLLVARPTMYYAVFSVIEIACTSFIVWYAWNWRSPKFIRTPDSLLLT